MRRWKSRLRSKGTHWRTRRRHLAEQCSLAVDRLYNLTPSTQQRNTYSTATTIAFASLHIANSRHRRCATHHLMIVRSTGKMIRAQSRSSCHPKAFAQGANTLSRRFGGDIALASYQTMNTNGYVAQPREDSIRRQTTHEKGANLLTRVYTKRPMFPAAKIVRNSMVPSLFCSFFTRYHVHTRSTSPCFSYFFTWMVVSSERLSGMYASPNNAEMQLTIPTQATMEPVKTEKRERKRKALDLR